MLRLVKAARFRFHQHHAVRRCHLHFLERRLAGGETVSSGTPSKGQGSPAVYVAPVSRTELNELRESVRMLQADLLETKQRYNNNEKARSNQIIELKECLQSVSGELDQLKSLCFAKFKTINLCVTRIEDVQCSALVAVKNDLKVLKEELRSLETSVSCVDEKVNKCINAQTGSKAPKSRNRSGPARSKKTTGATRPLIHVLIR